MIIEEFKTTSIDHYQYVSSLSELEIIDHEDVNIAIHKRNVDDNMGGCMDEFIQSGFAPLRTTLNVNDIDVVLDQHFTSYHFPADVYHLVKSDIKLLLENFAKICDSSQLKIFFGIVDTDMCRRFHSDMNELRMICSYVGQGTLWLTNDNVNEIALQNGGTNEDIVERKEDIKQLNTFDVALMKGGLYHNSNIGGLVHRSPTIENLNQKRIILRADSSSLFSNF